MKIGVGTFIVREEAKADLRGTIEKLAGIGYDGVELLGFFGRAPECVPEGEKRISALQGISRPFSAGDNDDDDATGFDPLLDASLDEGMLVEARVVAVRDDGRQLIVARFHVGEPKKCVVKEEKK